jgi:hypothetical protein
MKQTGRYICVAGAQNILKKKSVHGKAKLVEQERWYELTGGVVRCRMLRRDQ